MRAMISSMKRSCLRWRLLEELVDVDVIASIFWYRGLSLVLGLRWCLTLVLLISYHLYEVLSMPMDHALWPRRSLSAQQLPDILSSWRLEMSNALIQNKIFEICDELSRCLALFTS